MSRAFVKETAESAPPPERMVDEGPNLVTPEGLAQIDAHLARIEASMKSETNVLLRETLARDLEAAAREAREQVQWTCESSRTPRATGERQRAREVECPALL
jgi:hypothetical protein